MKCHLNLHLCLDHFLWILKLIQPWNLSDQEKALITSREQARNFHENISHNSHNSATDRSQLSPYNQYWIIYEIGGEKIGGIIIS